MAVAGVLDTYAPVLLGHLVLVGRGSFERSADLAQVFPGVLRPSFIFFEVQQEICIELVEGADRFDDGGVRP
ncbi:hypothetical protein D3C73_1343790 [compost metagenome]